MILELFNTTLKEFLGLLLSLLSIIYFKSLFFLLTAKYNPNNGFFILTKSVISIALVSNSSCLIVAFSITQNELLITCSYKSSLYGIPFIIIDENRFTLSFILSENPLN